MDLEERVEALEYLVCFLAQQARDNADVMGGIEHTMSNALFFSDLDQDKRDRVEKSLKAILRKLRNSSHAVRL